VLKKGWEQKSRILGEVTTNWGGFFVKTCWGKGGPAFARIEWRKAEMQGSAVKSECEPWEQRGKETQGGKIGEGIWVGSSQSGLKKGGDRGVKKTSWERSPEKGERHRLVQTMKNTGKKRIKGRRILMRSRGRGGISKCGGDRHQGAKEFKSAKGKGRYKSNRRAETGKQQQRAT